MSKPHFTPDFFAFLAELAQHNNKPWFDANKARYEASVKDAMLGFIADLSGPLRGLAPHFVADPRPVGGSLLRIYRDTRFAKDKTPYKTNMAAQFWHEQGREGATPAFYLHLAPERCLIGAGIWHPNPQALGQIRAAIAAQPATWQDAVHGADRRSACGLIGETLKKPPAGFPADHPCIEDLKRKDFAVSRPLVPEDVLRADFLDLTLTTMRDTLPFVQFLSGALGLAR